MSGPITADRGLYQACMLLGRFTRLSFDPWALMGPARRRERADVMAALMGRKVPVAKCGVSALRDELERRAGVTGECLAERADNFRALCLAEIGDTCRGYLQQCDQTFSRGPDSAQSFQPVAHS